MNYTTLGKAGLRVSVAGLDTAPSDGTEGVVGKALKTIPREQAVLAAKAFIRRNEQSHLG